MKSGVKQRVHDLARVFVCLLDRAVQSCCGDGGLLGKVFVSFQPLLDREACLGGQEPGGWGSILISLVSLVPRIFISGLKVLPQVRGVFPRS